MSEVMFSEDIRRGGYAVEQGGADIKSAAGTLSDLFFQYQQFERNRLSITSEITAKWVKVEGMCAANTNCTHLGMPGLYTEKHFKDIAKEIEILGRSL
jgi:hypothetical protein